MMRPAANPARIAVGTAFRATTGAGGARQCPPICRRAACTMARSPRLGQVGWMCARWPAADEGMPALAPRQQQRRWKSEEQLKSRYRSGPFSWKAGLLFAATGAFLLWFFPHEKERMRQQRMAEANKSYGKARVGGPFELVDTDGNKFTEENLKGRYSLVYFGFTHCPDICPEELDKMARMYELVNAQMPNHLQPIFITCDPARDDPKTLARYLREFHPHFRGLTGTYDQVKATCKAYRVYFSTPENVKPGEDYLVDHSIYFYIMDPEGDFVEVLGRQHSPEEGAKVMLGHMRDWKGGWKLP